MRDLLPSAPPAPGELERSLLKRGLTNLAGVDEAGRGALCGPVVAACVLFPPHRAFPDGLADSKVLSAASRERLEPIIQQAALSWGLGVVGPEDIDRANILQATFEAMRLAVAQATLRLPIPLHLILVDGNQAIPNLTFPQKTVIKGDALSPHIAAASILAKVGRDRIMAELALQHPGYGIERHMGYGTAEHMAAIRRLGLTGIHRKSFCRAILCE